MVAYSRQCLVKDGRLNYNVESIGQKQSSLLAAAIAQWIHLGLPSWGPTFESQAHHLRLFYLK